MDDKRAKLDAKGFKQEKYDSFIAAQTELNIKDSAQTKSEETAESSTAEQNQAIAESKALVKKTLLTARSAFGEDKRKLKVFKVDEKIPRGITALGVLCEYLGNTCDENLAVMQDNGMTAEDIANLKSAPERLKEADTAQSSALKAQKTATQLRDDAAKAFKSEIKKIRNFVKAQFSADAEMLIAFEPIPKGGGGRSSKEQAQQSPEQQAK